MTFSILSTLAISNFSPTLLSSSPALMTFLPSPPAILPSELLFLDEERLVKIEGEEYRMIASIITQVFVHYLLDIIHITHNLTNLVCSWVIGVKVLLE